MKIKPQHADFVSFPEIDFRGKLNTPVSYQNTYIELVTGMKNPIFRKNMADAAVQEVYARAYNYTAMMFAGYNRLSYICMMYAEEVKKCFLKDVFESQYSNHYLIGLLTCDMAGLTHPSIKEPYVIVDADNEEQAVEIYNTLVPLTAYYSAHVVAHKKEGETWNLCSQFTTVGRINQIIKKLEGDCL